MKQLLLFIGCIVFLSAITGCQNGNKDATTSVGRNSQFPEFLAGIWESQTPEYNWAFKFERDGSISKIIHILAKEVDLNEGGVFWTGPDPGTYALFVMGPCEAQYNKRTRELKVKIILDNFQMALPQGELEGYSHDYFKGPVSADGKIWEADWLSYSQLKGSDPPDPNVISPEPITFRKIPGDKFAVGNEPNQPNQ
jgi:hypothetical protein